MIPGPLTRAAADTSAPPRQGVRRLATETCTIRRQVQDVRQRADGSEDIRSAVPVDKRRNKWGEWLPGAPTTIRNVAIVTAPGSRRREVGSDGSRLEADRTIWSETEFQAGDGDQDGDIVIYDHQEWRVTRAEKWGWGYEVELNRLEQQPPVDPTTGTDPFERALRRWVALGSGLFTLDDAGQGVISQNVIPAYGPGVPPQDVFAVVEVTIEESIGSPHQHTSQDPDSGLTRTTTGVERKATVRVSFMRPGAGPRALQFLGWIETDDGKLEEERLGLTVQRGFERKRQDALVGDRYDETWVVEFEATRITTRTDDTGAFLDAGITLDLDAEPTPIREHVDLTIT